MIITSVHIYGFGKYQDFTAEFGHGLNLVEGSNEAGKSTLLAFVRAILFGFESRRTPEDRYEPLEGGKFGGIVTLRDSMDQEYQIERIGNKKAQGTVRVILPSGEEKGEEWLGKLLGGTTPSFYSNIYSFGLTELSLLGNLNQEDVAHFLYNSGTGVSLQQWEKSWIEEAEKLFKPRGTQPLVNQLLVQVEELDGQIRHLQAENDAYNTIHQELDFLNGEIEQLQSRDRELKLQCKRWEKLKQLYPLWQDVLLMEARLREFPDTSTFPEQGIARLDQLDREILSHELDIEEDNQKLAELQDKIARFTIDDRILSLKEEIEHLFMQSTRWEQKNDQLLALSVERDHLYQAIENFLSQLGPDWSWSRLREFDTTISRREMLREQRLIFQAFSTDHKTLKHLKAEREEELLDVKREYDKMIKEEPTISEGPELDRVEQDYNRFQALYHTVQNDQSRLEWMKKEWERERSQRRANTKATLQWKFISILTLFLAFALSTGWYFWFRDAWWLVIPVIVSFLLSIIYGYRAGSLRTSKSDHTYANAIEDLTEQIKAKQSELMTLSMNSFHGERSLDAIAQYIQQLRQSHRVHYRAKEKKSILGDKLQQLHKEIDKLDRKLQELSTEYDLEQGNWIETLRELGLPTGLSPEGVLEVLSVTEKAKDKLQKYDEIDYKCRVLDNGLHDFTSRVDELCSQVDILLHSEQSWTKMKVLHRLAMENEEAYREAERMRSDWKERKEGLEKKERLCAKLKAECVELLKRTGANDREHFRQLSTVYLERKKREEERSVMTHALYSSASQEIIDMLPLYSREEVEARVEQLAEELEQLHIELQESLDRRGQWKNKISRLESGQNLSALYQQREETLYELGLASKQWTVYRMAYLLLKRTRESYESKRQPGVLKRATEYFYNLTGGRYTRVYSPVGEQKIYVERHDGMRLEPGYLSRGTKEQLFLSLRFSLIEECAGPEPLPIILDDIFVNFDGGRTQLAIECLLEVSKHQQVLFFTCHSHVANQLRERVPCLNEINLRQRANNL
ncbi:AAA family ATPase [Ammoniphilus sp. CFH 90114]|uniref:ATP-binding protein n=1 Tax=Ammoniphilus sp. CFH 90114 TaxID=2493665 RepID=UPI0013E9863D|nr:AAA family ATPase [Ammoniphilus sp. CFH 90114]